KSDVQAALAAGVDAVISGTIDGLIDDPVIRFFTAKQTGYISTLALYETIANPEKSVAAQRYFDPDFINSKHLYTNMGSSLMTQNWQDWWDRAAVLSRQLPTVRGNTLALIKAGALVGIGTDAGTPSVIFGASLAYEMLLHEQLGLAPLAVIQMASLNNAKILKISHRTGSIAPGREADLVLLTQDPTGGIKAINSLVWTMQNGEITYRRELTMPGSR
ncbi:MAG: amidohydrolase family protein, partial [Kordiimonadaceae bacterium]|nr:amidohydrolase family protein [Kordiimonadaceae bacterium]